MPRKRKATKTATRRATVMVAVTKKATKVAAAKGRARRMVKAKASRAPSAVVVARRIHLASLTAGRALMGWIVNTSRASLDQTILRAVLATLRVEWFVKM